jgi:subtilisin family serine protease
MAQPRKLRGPGSESEFIPRVPKGTKEIVLLLRVAHASPVGGDPSQGDPAKAPDITNNSWGCPPSEGCSANTLQAAVEAQRTAGIMMVVSAGSSGSSCSTVQDPPAIYDASYTVGAFNTGTDTIASFSSRGPVTIDGRNRIKPDITAPGTNTRSASNSSDSAYTTASGTSMSSPHIAGAVALLWSANPALQNDIDASETTLNNSAVFISSTQCGTAGSPNNVYGWGRVDILAAVTSGPQLRRRRQQLRRPRLQRLHRLRLLRQPRVYHLGRVQGLARRQKPRP